MPADNPPRNDETLAVIDERERRMREGAERDVSRIPWGPRRVRLASGLWPHGIKTQLNFKMICATPCSSPPFLANVISVVAVPPWSVSSKSYDFDDDDDNDNENENKHLCDRHNWNTYRKSKNLISKILYFLNYLNINIFIINILKR